MYQFLLRCTGRCTKFDTDIHTYKNGAKRCSSCEIFMMCKSMRCPCCNNILKSKNNQTPEIKVHYI